MPAIEPTLELVREQLGIDPHIWLVGEEHIPEHGAPPRYVWVPMDEDEEDPAELDDDDDDPAQALTVARRLSTLVVHIWGENLGDTEDRWHDLRAALAEVCGKSATVGTGKWASGAILHCGVALHMPITFKFRVAADGKYTYSKAPHTQEIDESGSASGDNVLQIPE